jgi:hypothetical protein
LQPRRRMSMDFATCYRILLRLRAHRHGKNVNSDVWRKMQLWRSTANRKHPYCRFSTGNYETLMTKPKARRQMERYSDRRTDWLAGREGRTSKALTFFGTAMRRCKGHVGLFMYAWRGAVRLREASV